MDSFIPFLPANVNNILVLIVVLAVVWILIRFIFKLAMRVMALGCVGILILGGILIAIRMMR